MSTSEAADILATVCEGGEMEPGGEAFYLRRLEVENDLDRLGDALRSLADIPCQDSLERETRKQKARRALLENPQRPSSVATWINSAFGLGDSGGSQRSTGAGRPVQWEALEPWTEAVNGEELANAFEETLRRYVGLPEGGPEATTLWALTTYAFDAFNVSPILACTSPEKECGKTTLRNVLAGLVRSGWKCTASISAPAIFRTLEANRADPPTILIDEVDNLFTRRGGEREAEIKTLLNSGHTRDESAIRCVPVGDGYESRQFSTWAPKALFLIERGGLDETTRSRSIQVRMRRLAIGEAVEDFDIGEISQQLLPLRRKAARWAKDNVQALRQRVRSVALPHGMRGRAADNWRPLLTVAELSGGGWPGKARNAWEALSARQAEGDRDSTGEQLLADIRDLFDAKAASDDREPDKLFTQTVLDHLNSLEDRPWAEWGRTRNGLTAAALAKLLSRFEVGPRDLRIGSDNRKGYRRSNFEDAWSRYLSPSPAVTPRQSPSDGGLRDSPAVTPGETCHGCELAERPMTPGYVTVSRPESGGGGWEDTV